MSRRCLVLPINTRPDVIINHDRTGQSGYTIIIPRNEVESVWQAFLLIGVQPVGTEALDILRLEAAFPRYESFDENTRNLGGRTDRMPISFNKGVTWDRKTVLEQLSLVE